MTFLLQPLPRLARKPFQNGQSCAELLTMWNKTGVFSAMGCFPVTDWWGCNLSSCSWNLCLLCFSFICSSFWDSSILLSSVLKNIHILFCFNFLLGRKDILVHLFAFLILMFIPYTWGWIMTWKAKIDLESAYGVCGGHRNLSLGEIISLWNNKEEEQTSNFW